MAIVVTRNFAPLAQTQLSTVDLMREVGLLARELVYRRTIAGRDSHDAAFAPYSAGYRERKASELGAGTVNLQVSGAMLNAMQIVELTDDKVVLGFTN